LREQKLHTLTGVRVFGFLLLLALVATAGLPVRAAAQNAAPAQNQSAAQAQTGEEQQIQVFRLEGPIIKWTAAKFHLSIETTADIYEVINFLIIALAIFVPLFRYLPGTLGQRKTKLSDDLQSARKVKQDADSRLSAVEAKLAKLDEEIQKFRSEVEADAKGDEARIKASLADESKRIVDAAEQEISLAAAQARRGLRHFAADLAIDRAARELNLTPELDRALIAEFVGDMVRTGGHGEKN
jgi:F-type H+-transporting ATPase subunit b